jgi:hypothetical protein
MPLLRWEWHGLLSGGLAFLRLGKPPNRYHGHFGKTARCRKGRKPSVKEMKTSKGAPPLSICNRQEASRRHPRSQVIMTILHAAGSSPFKRLPRRHEEAQTATPSPSATRRSGPQAVGARGASPLPLVFVTKPSPSAPWARGLLSVSWEPGYPDLPACGPGRGSLSGLVRPISSIDTQDPREGPSLARKTAPRPPGGAARQGWLLRSGDIYATLTS